MKILHVVGAFDKKLGGTYSAILSIMNMENSLGYENEILALQSAKQEYDNDVKNKIHLFPSSFPYLFSYSKDANAWLNKNINNYNLILIHEVWSALAIKTALLAYKRQITYVIWPHGSLDPFDLQKKKWLKKVSGYLLISNITSNASAICCTSELERDVLTTYNHQNSNIYVLPLPINYEIKGDRSVFRKAYNIPDDSLVFLFLSRIDYKKGLDLFLYAYKAFMEEKKATDTKLLIAGKGTPAYEAYILNIIKTLALDEYVIVNGFLTGVSKANAYASANCFVLPSMNENYGISVIEALQSGLPVLISDNIYIWKSIIPDGGWVCQHDVNSILNKILLIYHTYHNNGLMDKTPVKVGELFKQNNLMTAYASFYNKMLVPEIQIFQAEVSV